MSSPRSPASSLPKLSPCVCLPVALVIIAFLLLWRNGPCRGGTNPNLKGGRAVDRWDAKRMPCRRSILPGFCSRTSIVVLRLTLLNHIPPLVSLAPTPCPCMRTRITSHGLFFPPLISLHLFLVRLIAKFGVETYLLYRLETNWLGSVSVEMAPGPEPIIVKVNWESSECICINNMGYFPSLRLRTVGTCLLFVSPLEVGP